MTIRQYAMMSLPQTIRYSCGHTHRAWGQAGVRPDLPDVMVWGEGQGRAAFFDDNSILPRSRRGREIQRQRWVLPLDMLTT